MVQASFSIPPINTEVFYQDRSQEYGIEEGQDLFPANTPKSLGWNVDFPLVDFPLQDTSFCCLKHRMAAVTNGTVSGSNLPLPHIAAVAASAAQAMPSIIAANIPISQEPVVMETEADSILASASSSSSANPTENGILRKRKAALIAAAAIKNTSRNSSSHSGINESEAEEVKSRPRKKQRREPVDAVDQSQIQPPIEDASEPNPPMAASMEPASPVSSRNSPKSLSNESPNCEESPKTNSGRILDKYERKKASNKRAAQISRERKKQYIKELEIRVSKLESKSAKRKEKLAKVNDELLQVKAENVQANGTIQNVYFSVGEYIAIKRATNPNFLADLNLEQTSVDEIVRRCLSNK